MKTFLVFLLLSIFFSSCSHDFVEVKKYMEGHWVQEEKDFPAFESSSSELFLKNDSFYYHFHHGQDYADPKKCNKFGYDYYSTGTYGISREKINLNGIWTDKTYKNPDTSECGNRGEFSAAYFFIRLDSNTLLLAEESLDYYKDDFPMRSDMKRMIRKTD